MDQEQPPAPGPAITRLVPRDWQLFQHYRKRSPPWIKLHKSLLDDFEFQCLPVASRALAPMLWLVASESIGGTFESDSKRLAFRLHTTPEAIDEALKPLIERGYFLPIENASGALASRKHDAMPEAEAEAKYPETEAEPDLQSARTPLSTRVAAFPLTGGEQLVINEGDIRNWQRTFNHIDVAATIRRLAAWCERHPPKHARDQELRSWLVARLREDNSARDNQMPRRSQVSSIASHTLKELRERSGG